jgi:exosortase K
MKSRLVLLLVAGLMMWALKRHYADADVDELRWILGPTARAVAAVTRTSFERRAGEGYFSTDRMFLIEKACAGINFMVAAFCMVTYRLSRRVESASSIGCVLFASAAASYAAAVVVNALRISFALWLAAHPVCAAAMTAAQIHRLEGIVVYFGGLVLLHEAVQRFGGADRPRELV